MATLAVTHYMPHAWARDHIAALTGTPLRLPAGRDALRDAVLAARETLAKEGT